MSHRVPDLDANHGGSIGFNHLDNLDIRSGKGGAGSVAFSHRDRSAVWSERDEGYLPEHRKQASAHVPENVFNHIPWMERESEKKNKHACSMGRESVPVLEVPLSHLLFQDDEMLSWLQYPLEDSFDKNYCSEPIFEQALNAPSHNAHDRFSHRTLREGEKLSAIGLPSQPAELSHSNVEGRTLTSDVAMAMGAFRVAGLLPQAGGEAFHRVRTTGQPSDPRETYEAPPPKATDALHVPSNAMDVHSALSLPSQHIAKQSALNFSLFSRPVAAMKTSLEILGTSTGPSNMEKTRKPFITHGNQGLSFSAAAVEFTAAASMSGLSSPVESDLSHQSKGKKQKTNCTSQQKCSPSMLSFRHENNAGKEKVELNTHFKMSAGIGSETQTVDVTLTSPSGGSGNSSEKSVKETAASSCKRKSCPAEESECESKDAEEVAASEKQPASGRPSPAKRTRAAEIHNQSERKRRNKINDRMKALQELIPNSNKTDKASMLDEAIEYVKTLQAQLQLMSMRTGMVVPSVMTSPGMQYPSIQQRLVSSHMNMGMGVSMGLAMGIGMLDASATGVCAGRAVVAMPPFLGQPVPGPAYHVAGYQPSGSSSIVHEAQGHMHVNEGHNLSTHQLQPLHLNMQISSDMRRAFMQQHQTQENFTSKEP